MEAEEQQRQILQSELEEKLEERKRSMELGSSENGLQLMERRQFRQFSRADEYLYAMKEDLAEWMNNLYPHIDMDADNFMNRLETGEHLVQVGLDSRKKGPLKIWTKHLLPRKPFGWVLWTITFIKVKKI